MATVLTKSIERLLPRADHRGRSLTAKVAPEGVYLKTKGERWSSAYFVPWGAIYTQGAMRKAEENKRERQKARQAKKAGTLAAA